MIGKVLGALVLLATLSVSASTAFAQACSDPSCATADGPGLAATVSGQPPGGTPASVKVVVTPPAQGEPLRADPLRPTGGITGYAWLAALVAGATTLTLLTVLTRKRRTWRVTEQAPEEEEAPVLATVASVTFDGPPPTRSTADQDFDAFERACLKVPEASFTRGGATGG